MLTAAFSSAIKSQNVSRVATRSVATSQGILRYFSAATNDKDKAAATVKSAAEKDPIDKGSVIKSNESNYPPLIDFDDLPITFADISRAEVAIRGGVKRTTCEHSPFISELVGANVYFKNEFRQFTGSFKERGARNAILQLLREKGSSLRGVTAASAGNHAQALAYHGRELGVPVTVVMPVVAPMAKVDKCRVSLLMLLLVIGSSIYIYIYIYNSM